MTTYFTPVGTLAEETRATGAAINARETAVETAFTALEAVIAITDGTASIVMDAQWTVGASTKVKKTLGTLVVLNFSATATGTPDVTIATLPAGYRPATAILSAAGVATDDSTGLKKPARFNISTGGAITGQMTDTGQTDWANGDSVTFHIAFFNA